MPLPIRMAAAFEQEMAYVPLEEIDPFYQNIPVRCWIAKMIMLWRNSYKNHHNSCLVDICYLTYN